MRKVSSLLTFFYSKIIIWIYLLFLVIGISTYFIFNLKVEFLFVVIFAFSIFVIPWFFIARNLKIVFLGKNYFYVDDEKIFFDRVESIEKNSMSQNYTVRYLKDNKIMKFTYLPTFLLPFFTHSYVKEIRENIKKEKKTND